MTNPLDSPWKTPDQAAPLLGYPASTVRSMCRAEPPKIRRRRIEHPGKRVRYLIHIDDITKHCQAQMTD